MQMVQVPFMLPVLAASRAAAKPAVGRDDVLWWNRDPKERVP